MEDPAAISLVQKKILQFFQKHPEAVETVRGIAGWVGTDASTESIQKALSGLVERKWIGMHESSVVIGYVITSDPRLLNQIGQACAE